MATFLKAPDTSSKLDILSASARFDICLSSCSTNSSGTSGRIRDPLDPLRKWIYPAHVPGKGRVGILKVLQTNVCKNRCTYCSFSALKDNVVRTGFRPDELAKAFMELVRTDMVHGIFISSGVGVNTDTTMEKMILTAEILRKHYRFDGYIHLKILPGASYNLIEAAASYANRLSVNLESPGRELLGLIAPDKDMIRDLVLPMKQTGEILRRGARASSQTTQFVVGATDESDCDIMKTVDWIYRRLFVFRAYFSAYQPDERETGRPLPPEPLLREHRLYQCDFLLRAYGFGLQELVFDASGNIPLDVDPKTAYAMMHPECFPVDINRAEKHHLLRVPGIGPVSAERIIRERIGNPFHGLEALKGTGVVTDRSAPYILFSGKRDRSSAYRQRWLFEETACSGWRTGVFPYRNETFSNKAKTAMPQPPSSIYPALAGKPVAWRGRRLT
ncbi:MAG: helix-hairpin-helix domain-containing protein [Spirochaetales bacterium]|nr:helix-hairpin-helix domain-containing protein [Spirochaetales bacterium]